MEPITRDRVWDLSDRDLVVAVAWISQNAEALEIPLTVWEKKFCPSIVEQFMHTAGISWKQRRACRKIVESTAELLQHRVELNAAIKDNPLGLEFQAAQP